MSQLRPEDIEKRLREVDAPSPPEELLDRLQADIPERPVVVSIRDDAEDDASVGHRGRWLVAASVAVALIGGSVAWQVARQMERSEAVAVDEAAPYDEPGSEGLAGAESATVARAADPTAADAAAGDAAGRGARDQVASAELPKPAPADPEQPRSVDPTAPRSDDGSRALSDLGAATIDGRRSRAEAGEAQQNVHSKEKPPIVASVSPYEPIPEAVLEAEPEPEVLDPPDFNVSSEAPPLAAPPPYVVQESPLIERNPSEERGLATKPGVLERETLEEQRSGISDMITPSTGGTTEPNDQPYGDMFFQSAGVNPFIDTEDDNLSTFGLDVDTGAYTLTRSYIERGHLPPPEAVRVEEMVNFFDYGDAPPVEGDFRITLEGAPTPFAEGPRYRLLRVNVRGREVAAADRLPATLVFVVDVSGSMNRENRLGLVKRSLHLLLDQLRSGDRVGLVVYGNRGEVLLEPTGDLERIRAAIERLSPGGSTNAEEGLVLAYELAERYYRAGDINRVVLCSDGVANVGRTGPESILERIAGAAERGIELTTVGFGMGNYNDVLMERLADRGDGNYAYVDALDEARRIFVEELTGTLQTIARDAKIQVEFNAHAVSRYRLLGYENRDVADERFRDDTVDAGEIGAGHSVTALYEIKLREGARERDELARVHLRYHSVAAGEVVETAASLRLADLATSWDEASPALRLASLVAEHAEILRRSFWAKEGDPTDVFRRAQELSPEFPGDVAVAELVGLMGRAAELAPRDLPALALEDR